MRPAATAERLAGLIEKWRHPTGPRRLAAVLTTAGLIAVTTLLVYATGGTQSVYTHLMYASVLVSAFYFRIPGGILAGIGAGRALGPLMPLSMEAGIPQTSAAWLFRLSFFTLVGAVAGLGFQVLNTQLDWLRHYAYHDALTGLPNLAAMREHIHRLESRPNEFPPPGVQVIAFNLANLPEIVSSLGYRKTEQLIQKLARRLQMTFVHASLFARVDSDKFAAVLVQSPHEAQADPLAAFRDLRDTSMVIDEVPIHVETSIGLASLRAGIGDPDALIPMAEIAARQAHASGQGVAVYDDAQDSRNRETLRLLGELRKAIHEHQLLLHYQPKLHLASGRITGVEALVRWRHPHQGIISPGRFMPMAEHTALIKPITRWVVEAALRQLAHWQRSGLELAVAVNLSTHNLHEPDLIAHILELIERYEIPQEKLTLEITESALMYPTGEIVQTLARLRERGIRIAIDDFGTGYSCLAYLKRLPVTSLKIDQSFLRSLEDERDRIIVRTAVDFGHHLGLNVVAEGVETQEGLDFLRETGCDVVQGYFIGRPMSAEQLRQVLQEAV